ncbi:hypothetical protein A2Z33_04375 [Candidatus Gottesmanbacteria bacterium RBG_16_52_11]|uniref:Uncharacterized protein n=1 Tax=Candidatus Gottesmanbacteria bacterium RBG_16_52_11 TaxID=1798374 RepID=A0A1F5YW04_9BACT|nr:MAG: hypothetical protein A2Z33_04375 [Candidatus Gottesmanbacteria bacterium RBG_16_52_11]
MNLNPLLHALVIRPAHDLAVGSVIGIPLDSMLSKQDILTIQLFLAFEGCESQLEAASIPCGPLAGKKVLIVSRKYRENNLDNWVWDTSGPDALLNGINLN